MAKWVVLAVVSGGGGILALALLLASRSDEVTPRRATRAEVSSPWPVVRDVPARKMPEPPLPTAVEPPRAPPPGPPVEVGDEPSATEVGGEEQMWVDRSRDEGGEP